MFFVNISAYIYCVDVELQLALGVLEQTPWLQCGRRLRQAPIMPRLRREQANVWLQLKQVLPGCINKIVIRYELSVFGSCVRKTIVKVVNS